MNRKFLALAGLVAVSLSSVAPALAEKPDLFNDKMMMMPFYTGEDMKTLRPQAEFDTAYGNLKSEDRDIIRTQCQDQMTQHENFCKMFMNSGKM